MYLRVKTLMAGASGLMFANAVLLMLSQAESLAGEEPKSAFVPPGPNIALHKPYTMAPAPNYGGACADPGDSVQLTDGEYTGGGPKSSCIYFRGQKSTVGWGRSSVVRITIDLGKVEPIAGVSYSTASGTGRGWMSWPANIWVLASDDGKAWTCLGNLARVCKDVPGPEADCPYRYAANLKGAGRYVQLIVPARPGKLTFMDEIEVYQGPQSLLAQGSQGPKISNPMDLIVLDGIQSRLLADLSAIRKEAEAAKLPAGEAADLLARADKLKAEVEQMPVDAVKSDFRAIMPLNELHSRIYALNAPLLRARGCRELAAWMGNRWDNLQPTEAPAQLPAQAPELKIQMMSDEYRAEAFNLSNPNDKDVQASFNIVGLPGGTNPAYVSPREVLFTDTYQGKTIATALPPAPLAQSGFQVVVPAGMTKQVWLSFHPTDVKPGSYRGELKVSAGEPGKELTLPLTLQVYPFKLPAKLSVAIGGWDYTNGKGGFDLKQTPIDKFVRNLQEHFVDIPWANSSVVERKDLQFGADGQLLKAPDFSEWDEWVARWPDARCYAVFLRAGEKFNDEQMGSPRFNRMLGDFVNAWVEHMKKQGLRPDQLMLCLVDEPGTPKQDNVILTWLKAIKAVQPEVAIFEDTIHADPSKASQEMMSSCTILCPMRLRFDAAAQSYRDYYLAQQKGGRELAFYSCDFGKQSDPISYYRGQFWTALKHNAKKSFFWGFCDERGPSWNQYLSAGGGYSPVFFGPEGTTDAKHMEAIREGAEDYECFQMLRKMVEERQDKGMQSPLLARAKAFLEKAPDQALEGSIAREPYWDQERDRGRMDRTRIEALDLMSELSDNAK